MLQEESYLDVADNTGVLRVKMIRVKGGTGMRYARVGDVITCSVRACTPTSPHTKGKVLKALVVRTKARIIREDGATIQFGDNACVIIDDAKAPRGSRIFGSIPKEIREKSPRVCSLASEVI